MPVTECSVCLEHFENNDAYRNHLQFHKHRATELLQDLQASLHHISAQPRLINARSTTTLPSSANQPIVNHFRTRSWICPHPDCAGKLKRAFKRRKDLVRHAEAHKECEEECLFCEIPILRVRKYFTHYDMCPTRLAQQQTGILSMDKDNKMRGKRQRLHEGTDLWLEEMLHSAAPNSASMRRRKASANAIQPRATGFDVAHTNRHSRPSPHYGAPRLDANAMQTDMTNLNDSRATGLEASNVRGVSMIASQSFSALNDLLQGIDPGYTTSLPTFDLSAIDDHSLLPRAPVVTSYTMDEPYYINSSDQSLESGASHLTNGYVDGADSNPYQRLANQANAGQGFGN